MSNTIELNVDNHNVFIKPTGETTGSIHITGRFINGSTYWGAMGCGILEFLLSINGDYFANRLVQNDIVYSSKKTARAIRKEFSEHINYWQDMEEQKEFRKLVKEIENGLEFNEGISNIIERHWEGYDIKQAIKWTFDDCYYLYQQEYSREYKYAYKFLKELQRSIKTLKSFKYCTCKIPSPSMAVTCSGCNKIIKKEVDNE